ncbi:endonuclease/exonuclease/phosphatase family protein [Tenacibaculum amylolyticum]|uniref:endonuclease/exonuclease/phosphatase family protein n=1 Tax=Tenacibaculum amylolyticum TaxID=104269 RepID=UPI00389655DA
MKKTLAFLFKLVVVLFFSVAIFYYWGSGATLEESSYTTLTQKEYESTIKNDSIFSIVTYNIGYLSGMTNNRAVEKPKELFDENLKTVTTEFKKVNPDIIAFQEIDYGANRSYEIDQEDEIAKLGYNYIAKGVNWDKKYVPFPYWPPSMHFGKVVSGQSILSKYPLKDYERIVLDRVADSPFYRNAFYLDRLLQVVKVTIQGKDVVVMNVHLEAFDKKTRVQQIKKVSALFQEYAKNYPTILLGDFNSDPNDTNPAVNEVLKLPSVGNAAFSKDNLELTYSSKNPTVRIDYIFYSKATIESVGDQVLKDFGEASDHLPVEMKFRLK